MLATIDLPANRSMAVIDDASAQLSEDERTLFVGASSSTSVHLVDTDSLQRVRGIRTGDGTDNIDRVAAGRYILASATFGRWSTSRAFTYRAADEVFVIDGRTLESLGTVRVGQNVGTMADLGDGTVLVTAVAGKRVARVDLSSAQEIDTLNLRRDAFHPGHVTVRSDGAIGVVTGGVYQMAIDRGSSRPIGDDLLILDPRAPSERSRLEFFRGLEHPRGALFMPDGRHVLVAERGRGALLVLDWVAGRTEASVDLAPRPEAIGWLDPQWLWVRHDQVAELSLLRASDGHLRTVTLPGESAANPVLSADGLYLYLPVADPHGVAVIQVATTAIVDLIRLDWRPSSVVATSDGSRLYVTHSTGRHVSVIE